MLLKYDFHVHTSRYSPCARSSSDDMLQKAIQVGLSGIALTEHDTWWPRSELRSIRQKFPDIVIFDGTEISCEEGHFLVFLPESSARYRIENCSIVKLRQIVDGHGGIIIWAHPFRYSKDIPSWLRYVKPDAMELKSSNMDDNASAMAYRVACEHGIPVLANSDAHHASTLGRFYNKLHAHLSNNNDLIRMIRGSKKGFR